MAHNVETILVEQSSLNSYFRLWKKKILLSSWLRSSANVLIANCFLIFNRSFMKNKLQNQLTTHFDLCVRMFNKKTSSCQISIMMKQLHCGRRWQWYVMLILVLLVCWQVLYVKFTHMGWVLGLDVWKLSGGYGCCMGWVQDPLVEVGKTLCEFFRFWMGGRELEDFLGSSHVFAIMFQVKFLIVCPMCHQCLTLFSSPYFAKCSYVVSTMTMCSKMGLSTWPITQNMFWSLGAPQLKAFPPVAL